MRKQIWNQKVKNMYIKIKVYRNDRKGKKKKIRKQHKENERVRQTQTSNAWHTSVRKLQKRKVVYYAVDNSRTKGSICVKEGEDITGYNLTISEHQS
jgi:hypothetical protein